MPFELFAGVLAFLVTSSLLPLVIRWARAQSLLDMPDGGRRRHAAPTPRLGGVAVFTAVVVATLAVVQSTGVQLAAIPAWQALLAAAFIVFLTGLIDDLRGVAPALKLVGHSTAALIVVAAGFKVSSVTLGGGEVIDLGILALPLTVLWIVGITNAFNLIDGVDGLASAFALIGLVAAAGVSMLIQPQPALVITASTIGAVLAFLRFNRSPARIFLGDAGSTTLGFFLSIQLVRSATGPADATYVLVPLFALAYPLTDTMIAIARRWLRGHPFSRADGRHIHHQVLAIGLAPRRTVDLLGLVFAAVAAMGVAISFAPPRMTIAIGGGVSVLAFAMIAYGIRWLGYHEFSELAASAISVVRNARRHVSRRIRASDIATQLGTAKSLEELRQILEDSAPDLGLVDITLELPPNHLVTPPHVRIASHNVAPIRVDCPLFWEQGDGIVGEATLRFWCERPDHQRHSNVERLALRLVPAVQQWFQSRQYDAHASAHGEMYRPDITPRTSGPIFKPGSDAKTGRARAGRPVS